MKFNLPPAVHKLGRNLKSIAAKVMSVITKVLDSTMKNDCFKTCHACAWRKVISLLLSYSTTSVTLLNKVPFHTQLSQNCFYANT